MCKQTKLNYLKLHIQSTSTKRFSPVAVDSIIRDFAFCPKILLHAAVSQNPSYTLTNSYNKLCIAKHSMRIYRVAYNFCRTSSVGLRLPDSLPGAPRHCWGTPIPRLPASSPQFYSTLYNLQSHNKSPPLHAINLF